MVGGMLRNVGPWNPTTQFVISCDIFKLWTNSGQRIWKTYVSLRTYIAAELPSNDIIGGPTHFGVVVDIAHHHIPAVHDCPLPLSYLEVPIQSVEYFCYIAGLTHIKFAPQIDNIIFSFSMFLVGSKEVKAFGFISSGQSVDRYHHHHLFLPCIGLLSVFIGICCKRYYHSTGSVINIFEEIHYFSWD